jgi:hypothetical protein
MNQIKITCPSCNETFSADEALRNHLKAKDTQHAKEIENNKKIAQEKLNLELKLMEKKAAKIAEDKAKTEIQQSQAKHELDLKQMEKKVIEKAQSESQAKIKAAQAEADKAKKIQKEKEVESEKIKKTAHASKAKFELDMKKEVETSKRTIEKEIQNKFKAEIQNAKVEAEKVKKQQAEEKAKHELALKEVEKKIAKVAQAESEKLKKEIERKDKAREIQDKRHEKRIDEMKKQMNQRSVEIQGEVQEELIQDFLKSSFPEDTVEEVKKGAKGADCLFSINYKDKKNLAQIYFESKDHKSFKEEWVDKLLKDMKAKSIGHSILVTTALPKDFNKAKNGYVGRHGNRIIIIPMDYSIIHAVVSLIRGNLINIYKTKKDLNVSRELTKLWDHITGPSFQIPMRTLYLSINKSRDLLEKEKTFWNKHLSNKERNLSDMDEQFMDVINSFTLKVSENLLPETLVQVERQAIKERNEKNSLANKKNKEDN